MNNYLGIDIGGTTISALKLEDLKVTGSASCDTGALRSVEQIMADVISLINELRTDDTHSIGVGVPGILDVNEGRIISINNIPVFNGFGLREALARETGLPVYINNDANCFALGEAWFGAGKGFSNIIGVTLGTGVGGGIVIDRKIYSGNLGAAGEFGCIPYEDGIFEAYGGSVFFERFYNRTGKELFNLAEQGDSLALEAFDKYGEHLATLLTQLMFFIAPEAIILGGSISRAFPYFEPALKRMLENFSIPIIAEHIKILPAALKDAGVLGAVALGMSNE